MKPKHYPYSGQKKQSVTNQVFSRVVGDTKISVNNNGVELEAPKIIIDRNMTPEEQFLKFASNHTKDYVEG